MIKVNAYRCEFCGKLFMTEKRCLKHEYEKCIKSTKVKNCRTCKFNDYDMGIWNCSKLDMPIEIDTIPICCEHHILELKQDKISKEIEEKLNYIEGKK